MVAIHTIRDPWQKVGTRDPITTADTLMTKDGAGGTPTKDWGSRSRVRGCALPIGANGIKLTVIGDVEDAEVTVSVYIYSQNGPAEWVAGITFKIGGQLVVTDPTDSNLDVSGMMYADVVTIVDQGWSASKLWREDYGEDDGVSKLCWDGEGGAFLLVEASGIDPGLTIIPLFTYW